MSAFAKKFGLVIIIALVLSALIFLFALPTVGKIKNINTEINNERARLEELYDKGQKLKNSKEKYLAIKENLPQLNAIFIKEKDELNLITKLEKIAAENFVSQEINLDVKQVEINKNLKKMPVTLHLQGTYRNLLSYLRSLEAADFYLNIFSLSFFNGTQLRNHQISDNSPATSSEANPILSLDLSGFVYYYQN